MAEMFRDMTRQLQEALSPAAASLHAGGNSSGINNLPRSFIKNIVIVFKILDIKEMRDFYGNSHTK